MKAQFQGCEALERFIHRRAGDFRTGEKQAAFCDLEREHLPLPSCVLRQRASDAGMHRIGLDSSPWKALLKTQPLVNLVFGEQAFVDQVLTQSNFFRES